MSSGGADASGTSSGGSVSSKEEFHTPAAEVCEISLCDPIQLQNSSFFLTGGYLGFSGFGNASDYAYHLGLTYYLQTANIRGQIVREYTN